MIAMQYRIALPSDYDMEIIRKRVQNSGNKTDGFPGLKMKAYLVAEKKRYGNFENEYAPFYLWENEDGINQFILKGPFSNILNSFGRPVIHNWIVMQEYIEKTSDALFACVINHPISNHTDLTTILETEKELYNEWTSKTSTKACITAYNPYTWELCRFYMTTDFDRIKIVDSSLIYDVHHIS